MKNLLLMACMLLGISACNESPYEAVATEKQLQPDCETIAKLITGFDKATKRILSSNSDFSDAQMGEIYLNEIASLGIHIRRHASQSDGNFTAQTDCAPAFIGFVSQMADAPAFDSKEAYQNHLADLYTEVLNSPISKPEKQALINRIAFMHAFVDWMGTVADSTAVKGASIKNCGGWWSCWGKCVAGIVGNAIVAGTVGGLEGAAIGTVTVPVLGTVSAGAVGAIAGAIGGGIAGASEACD